MAGASLSRLAGQVSSARRRDVALACVKALLILIFLAELADLVLYYVNSGKPFSGIDSRYFYEVATRIVGGEVPYRDFFFEYPPLAIPPILLPKLVLQVIGGSAVRYAWLLAAENLAIVIATAACLVPLVRRGWSTVSTGRTVAGYGLLVLATPVLFWRFDSVPTLLMMLGLVAFAAGGRLSSGVALGAGIAAKLFPAAVVPILVAADLLRRNWIKPLMLVSGAIAAVAVVGILSWLGAGVRELSFVEYHADRGVQLESLLASVAMVGQLAGAPPAHVFNDFGAFQIDSPLLASVPWLGGLLAVALIGAVAVSTVVRFRADIAAQGEVLPQTLVTHLLAALLAVLLGYRVLSPQFLVWILPVAALRPRGEFWVIFVICLLTLAIYPLAYDRLIALDPVGMLMLIARNALMVATFVWLIGWAAGGVKYGPDIAR